MATAVYDMAAYIPTGTPSLPLRASPFSAAGTSYANTGIAKLAYIFLVELFTDVGSVPHFSDRGCLFMRDLLTGRFQTENDVMVGFAEAESRIRETINRDLAGSPNDELLQSAELATVTIEDGRVTLYIVITSVAGADARLSLPIFVSP